MAPEPIRVLLVDDDRGDYELTQVMLSEAAHGEYLLDWVSTHKEAVDALRKNEHHVYLVDYVLEEPTGTDLLREARRLGVDAPLIMLTGRGNRAVDLEAMEAGAADYLVKGQLDPEVLDRVIRYSLERTRTARALRESEERHRSMFDHLPVGLFRSEPDGSLIDANPALVRILGYPDRASLERLYAKELYVHPDDRLRFWNRLDRYGVVRGFESTLQRFDGVSIRVRNTARLHRSPEGVVLYMEGTVEDITEEKAAEGLRGSEARFRAVFESSRTGIALTDLDGIIQEVNPSFAEIFFATAKEMEGLSYPDLLSPEEQPAVLRELGALARGERNRLAAERKFHPRNGHQVWARTSTFLIRSPEGEPEQMVVLLDDVSEPV